MMAVTEMSVYAVCRSAGHDFSKDLVDVITLVADRGVEGDAHFGENVQHRSRLHIRPRPTNLRQVHLISREALKARNLEPGQIGENITLQGIPLLELSTDTRLKFVSPDNNHNSAIIRLTGVRNPCPQIDKFRKGLKETFLERDGNGEISARLAGVMAVVEMGGDISAGMQVQVEAPSFGFIPLKPV